MWTSSAVPPRRWTGSAVPQQMWTGTAVPQRMWTGAVPPQIPAGFRPDLMWAGTAVPPQIPLGFRPDLMSYGPVPARMPNPHFFSDTQNVAGTKVRTPVESLYRYDF